MINSKSLREEMMVERQDHEYKNKLAKVITIVNINTDVKTYR